MVALEFTPETEERLQKIASRIGRPLEDLFCVAMELYLEKLRFPALPLRSSFSRERDRNSFLSEKSIHRNSSLQVMGDKRVVNRGEEVVTNETVTVSEVKKSSPDKREREGSGEETLLFPAPLRKPRPKNKIFWTSDDSGTIKLPEVSDPSVLLLIPLKDGSCYPVTEGWLKNCKKAYTGVDVETATRDAYLYCLNHPKRAPERDGARFLQNWFSRKHKDMIRNVDELRAELSIPRRKGDPIDGESDREGNKWSEFNGCWMKPEAWAPKKEMEEVMLGIVNSAYGNN